MTHAFISQDIYHVTSHIINPFAQPFLLILVTSVNDFCHILIAVFIAYSGVIHNVLN